MKKYMLKNFSWSFIGSSIYALSQWLLIIIIMRFGSPYDAGVYSLGLAICAPIVMLINLNFRAIQSTNLSNEIGFNSFKWIRILGVILVLIVILGFLLVSDYNAEINIALFLITLSKIVESFSDLYYGLFQYHERLDLVSKSTIFRGLVGTFSFGTVYFITRELTMAILILCIIWTFNFIVYDYKNGRQFSDGLSKKIDRSKLILLLKIGFPIGLVSFIASLNVNIPRIIYEKFLTLEELGYFTSIFYLVLIIGKFMTSISNTVLPRLARLYEENEMALFLKIFKIIIVSLLSFSLLIIMISYFFGNELLTILYGDQYSSFKSLLILVMIYGLFNYLAFSLEIGLNAMKGYKYRLYIEILATLLVLFLSVYFIPNYGLNGGVFALIISAFLKFTLLAALFGLKYLDKHKYLNAQRSV